MPDADRRRPPVMLYTASAEVADTLTVADRISLMRWASQGSGGYAKVVLEDGVPGAGPDCSGYVLLYRQSDCWATLGLTRRAAGVLLWRCSDGAACGIHPTMAAALAALPPPAKAS